MKIGARPGEVIARHEPKTQRGRDTRDEILTAARKLASERWIDEVPFTELATEADVARASLLHAYPHWRNVLWDLFEEEVGHLDSACAAASTRKGVRPNDRAYATLASLLTRAEMTGLLYANLRAALFTWRGEPTDEQLAGASPSSPLEREVLAEFVRVRLQKHYHAIEELLGIRRYESLEPNEVNPVPIGECLVNFALDLAAGSPTHYTTFHDRRITLHTCVDLITAGASGSMSFSVKKGRR